MNETSNIEQQVERGRQAALQPEPAPTVDSSQHRGTLLLPALLLLFTGGLIGYLLGRQSVPGPTVPEVADAAVTNPIENNPAAFSPAAAGPTPASIVPDTLRALGDTDAPATIVEFADYQCPFCRRHFQQTFPQLKREYINTGRVYYVFKDFPIASLHPLAYRLHEAARCAGQSGADIYWQAHDLFLAQAEAFQANSVATMDAAIRAEFETGGLPDVSDCLAQNQYADAVQDDLAEGQGLGVNGTPTFFINGYPISGAQPYAVFQQAISMAEEGTLAEAFRPQAADSAPGASQAGQPVTVPLADEPAKGSPDAPITIVEYSDFQCPFCLRHFQQTLPQLQQYIDAGQVRYVFKDFPLHNIHPQAQKTHESARCARELGGDEAFWTMHDLLFANQEEWAGNSNHVDVFKSFAADLELPQAEFDDCLDSGRYAEAVNQQVAEGTRLGVRGTPTFFINGQPLVGAQPFAAFQQVN